MRRTVFLAGVLPFISAFLGGILAISIMAPSPATAQPTVQPEVRANAFVLVGNDGSERARFDLAPTVGAGRVVFYRANGTVATSVSGAGLTLWDADGNIHMRVGRCLAGFPCPGGGSPFEGVQLGPNGSIGMMPSP